MHATAEDARKQLKAVHQYKKDPDQVLEPLEIMCVSLVMGVERYLRAFDASAAISMLMRMAGREIFALSGDGMTMIFRALSLIMEYVPTSYESALLFHKQIIKTVCRTLSRTLGGCMKYRNTDNTMLLEESLRLIRFITKDEYRITVLRHGLTDIIQIAVSENTVLVRQALEVLLVICSKVILPSGTGRLFSFGLPNLFRSGKKESKNGALGVSNEGSAVFAVERVIVPFLHMTIPQYAANLESFPESWSCLEVLLKSLGMLIQRAMLSRRITTAKKIATLEMCRTVFNLLALNDRNLALEHSVRSERVLLCETLLSSLIAVDWTVASECLLDSDAQLFYKLVFADLEAEGTTQLENPFSIGKTLTSGSRVHGKDHIISISALRLLILSCPRVPYTAFGPKPKFTIPVHQWMWEDDMRHMNRIVENACITLEMGMASSRRETWVRTNTKSLNVDLHTMKISGGFCSTDCNVSRNFLPCAFRFMEGADIYPEVVKKKKKTKAKTMTKKNITACGADISENGKPPIRISLSSGTTANTTEVGSAHLNALCVINDEVFVPSSYIDIAEVYLECVCRYILSVSCSMTVQLGVCACASLLQAAIRCGEEQRLSDLLSRVMRPFCEMLREVLVSADKTTKSLALAMIVWLLSHRRASEWKFVETAHRCGVLKQLDILSCAKNGSKSKNKSNINDNDDRKVQGIHPERPDCLLSTVYVFGTRQSRSGHLMLVASFLFHMMSKKLASMKSQGGTINIHVMCLEDVQQASWKLMDCVEVPGVHRTALVHMLDAMERSIDTFTSFEASNLGVANALLSYLLGCKISDDGAKRRGEKRGETEDAAHAQETTSTCRFLEVGATTDLAVFNGTRVADRLHRECRKERILCFVECAMRRPHVVGTLIENLIAALTLETDLPLVESLLNSRNVSCHTPQKAVMTCLNISPAVRLCSKEVSDEHNNTEASAARSLSSENKTGKKPLKDSEKGEAVRHTQRHLILPKERKATLENLTPNPNEYCPNGHELEMVSVAPLSYACNRCEAGLSSGFFCDQCDFHLCLECCGNRGVKRGGNGCSSHSFAGSENTNAVADGGASGQQKQRVEDSLIIRAHLFSSIGDIERCFRTGTSLTRDTSVAPAPHSAMQNIDRLTKRVGYVLARRKKKCEYADLQHKVQCMLNSLLSRDSILNSSATSGKQKSGQTLKSEGTQTHSLLRDAMEERYILYRESTGRCAYQETLLGNLIQYALCEGHTMILEQLENCFLTSEVFADTVEPPELHLNILKRSTSHLPFPSDSSHGTIDGQTYVFHHFLSDDATRCCCGERTRDDLNTMRSSNMTRKPTRLSQAPEMLLLILLHKILHPLIGQGTIDIDASVFLSAHFTTFLLKSLVASALPVALLPPRLAVPRWVDFILVEANFLLPLSVREQIVRFMGYGARRALHNDLRSANVIRDCKSLDAYPAEWVKGANHKYHVRRNELLHDAYIVLRKSADSRIPVSIDFEEEVGIGQGPTAHFYTLVAQHVTKTQLRLWRSHGDTTTSDQRMPGRDNMETNTGDTVVSPGPEGLYPLEMGSAHCPWVCPGSPKLVSGSGFCYSDHVSAHYNFAMFDWQRTKCYYLVGAALGRAFLDGVIFPLDLSPALAVFLSRGIPAPHVVLPDGMRGKVVCEAERPIDFMGLSLDDLGLMDRSVSDSLRSLLSLDADKLNSLELPFTIPGNDTFEMACGGADMHVSAGNLSRYISRSVSALLYESVILPIRFIVYGFRDVVPCEAFASLGARETIDILCGNKINDNEPLWTLDEIKSILIADHGYQSDCPQLVMLQNILANRLTPKEQRKFLLFSTGCPRLPAGGVGALGGITVVKSSLMTMFSGTVSDHDTDHQALEMMQNMSCTSFREMDWPLPSVNTCFRYLKLPPYPTEELMYKKLLLSITHGGETFELS